MINYKKNYTNHIFILVILILTILQNNDFYVIINMSRQLAYNKKDTFDCRNQMQSLN